MKEFRRVYCAINSYSSILMFKEGIEYKSLIN